MASADSAGCPVEISIWILTGAGSGNIGGTGESLRRSGRPSNDSISQRLRAYASRRGERRGRGNYDTAGSAADFDFSRLLRLRLWNHNFQNAVLTGCSDTVRVHRIR